MPIIKSAKKRAKQNVTARERNHAQLSRMRSFVKNIIKWTENGKVEKAKEVFNDTQKAIDTCSKKNLIHKNNAARKKSRIAKLIANAKTSSKKSRSKKRRSSRRNSSKTRTKERRRKERIVNN
jgi:small subunit ribosomal protein S20